MPISADDPGIFESSSATAMIEQPRRTRTQTLSDAAEQMLDGNPVGSALLDVCGRLLGVNDPLCALLRRSREDLCAHTAEELTHPADRAAHRAAFGPVLHGEAESSHLQERLLRADGEELWVSVMVRRAATVDDRGVWIARFLDITETKQAERRLRERERQLADAQALAHLGSWEYDPRSGRMVCSDELCRIFGLPTGSCPTIAETLALVHPDDRQRVARYIRRGEPGAINLEYRVVRADGEVRHVHSRRFSRREADEAAAQHSGTVLDITERVRSERELRAAHEHLQAIVMAMGEGYALTVEGRIAAVNPRLCEQTGFSAAELVGCAMPFPFWPPEAARGSKEIRSAALERSGTTFHTRLVRSDGAGFDAEVTVVPARRPDGALIGFVNTVRDVTERLRYEREQVALREVAELIAAGEAPAVVFNAVARHVQALFGAKAGLVTRFDEAAGKGTILACSTTDGPSLAGESYDLGGQTPSAQVHRTGRTALLVGTFAALGSEDPARSPLERAGATGAIATPVLVAGRPWGTLSAMFAGQPMPDDAEAAISRFGHLVSMAVLNAEAWERLERQATTDSLTGLANHRAFHERLRSETYRARRYGRALCLALLDLDHFKDVNDRHGHQVGDRVLGEVAAQLADQAREGELISRIGGEEFAWLMPEADPAAARRACERARRLIAERTFAHGCPLTISAGICSFEPSLEPEEMIRLADLALYRAKHGGRNTTFLYTPQSDSSPDPPRPFPEPVATMASVRALARAIDSRDPGTREHSERVAAHAQRLALELGWTSKRASLLHECGLLHDVGKIGIPDEILLKPGPLNAAEYEQIKQHAVISARIAEEVLEEEQVAWIRGHHERWDGGGYPDGLAGEQIPDGAQLLALADAYDAMTSMRSYQASLSPEQALSECLSQAGSQFAPEAVRALESLMGRERGVAGKQLASARPG
jgi:diguanylate cyclase (GGDEF)-like protein/PAS domain S-box-containing protein/putative nucleotidyltransferase with HDIG domain